MLERVTGEEKPFGLNMHFGVFWVRIYNLLLMLRSEVMASKIGNTLGKFEEIDWKDIHVNEIFFRIKVTVVLKQTLKRGTVV